MQINKGQADAIMLMNLNITVYIYIDLIALFCDYVCIQCAYVYVNYTGKELGDDKYRVRQYDRETVWQTYMCVLTLHYMFN